MTVQEQSYTTNDLWRISHKEAGKRFELAQGVLIEMSPTGRPHNVLTTELIRLIANYARSGGSKLGEVSGPGAGFILHHDPDTVRSPDVAFISKERLGPMQDGYYAVGPDLAVEVISPGNSQSEIHEKVVDYFQAGTRLVWVIYTRSRAVYVYRAPTAITVLGRGDVLEGENVLPGLKIDVQELFAVLDS